MTSASVELIIQVCSLAANLIVVLRMLSLGLYRVYPLFFSFLCLMAVPESSSLFFGAGSKQFFYTYVYVEPLLNLFYILVVWELFSVIFRNYAGLRSLSRWMMGIAAAIAPIGFFLTIFAPGAHAFKGYSLRLIKFERGLALGLVIFIIILLFFISRYPIKLPRNNIVHCMLYSIWFSGVAALLVLASFVPKGYPHAINASLVLLGLFCYLGWAFLLSKTGEYQETRVRQNISPEREKALIGELNAMNDVLLRAARSISPSPSKSR